MKQLLEKTILLLVCISLVSCITDFKSNNLTFDSEQWKTGDLRLRGQMSNNLEKVKFYKVKPEMKLEICLESLFTLIQYQLKPKTGHIKPIKGQNLAMTFGFIGFTLISINRMERLSKLIQLIEF